MASGVEHRIREDLKCFQNGRLSVLTGSEEAASVKMSYIKGGIKKVAPAEGKLNQH